MFDDLESMKPLLGQFLQLGKTETFKKGDILLREGKICRKLFYVKEGVLRFYYENNEGQDITHWFLMEEDFITEINSLLEQVGSDYYLEALEDCTLITFTMEDLLKVINVFPEINMLWTVLMARMLVELGEKIKDLQFRDAKTRYDNLLDKYPDILQRVSLKHIASYLGITQQSLSRIRKIRG